MINQIISFFKNNMAKINTNVDTDLSRFKNSHSNRRCFIVGNGPSLNKMDLNKLDGEYTFCANAFFLMFPKIKWRPQYYTCVDTRVLPDRAADIIEMHTIHPEMVLFFPKKLINHGTQAVTQTVRIIPPLNNRIYFNQIVSDHTDLPFSAFSLNPAKYTNTVTITALQLAVFMGFDPIYLIGCDTNYKILSTVEKRGNHPELGKFLYTSTKDDDPNHFCPEYFGKGRRWHHPQVHNMIWHYQMTHDATKSIGKQIYNATIGGKLEVFPRVNFDDLFK